MKMSLKITTVVSALFTLFLSFGESGDGDDDGAWMWFLPNQEIRLHSRFPDVEATLREQTR